MSPEICRPAVRDKVILIPIIISVFATVPEWRKYSQHRLDRVATEHSFAVCNRYDPETPRDCASPERNAPPVKTFPFTSNLRQSSQRSCCLDLEIMYADAEQFQQFQSGVFVSANPHPHSSADRPKDH